MYDICIYNRRMMDKVGGERRRGSRIRLKKSCQVTMISLVKLRGWERELPPVMMPALTVASIRRRRG